jgi:rhomboid protease GluP
MNTLLQRLRFQIRKAPATWTLIFFNTIMLVLTLVLGGFTTATLLQMGGLVPKLVQEGEVWRLLASMFLHGGILHFLMNMMGLYYLGVPLERSMGSGRYAIFYLISGLGGGVAVTLLEASYTLTIGASGSVYGLMAALLFITFVRKNWFTPTSVRSIRTMIVVNFSITFLLPSISVWGHLGGFLFGFLLSLGMIPQTPAFVQKAQMDFQSTDDGEEDSSNSGEA